MYLIKKIVCEEFDINEDRIFSKDKFREIADAKKAYALLMRRFTDQPCLKIALGMGYKDHSSVLFASNSALELIKFDKSFEKKYSRAHKRVREQVEPNKHQAFIEELSNCITNTKQETLDNLIKLLL